MVRLKVQITLCTCCLDEGRKGWKKLSGLDGYKGGGGGVGEEKAGEESGLAGGVGLGCFSFEVRGGGVEAGSSKV